MKELAYRIAGGFCCLFAILMATIAIHTVFFTVMLPPGKILVGVGGLGMTSFFGYIGAKFLITGGPT